MCSLLDINEELCTLIITGNCALITGETCYRKKARHCEEKHTRPVIL